MYGHPSGLYGSLCTLHLTVTSFGATLDMGGWLSLTQQGLTPCQKHQALLGVLTFRIHVFHFGNALWFNVVCVYLFGKIAYR